MPVSQPIDPTEVVELPLMFLARIGAMGSIGRFMSHEPLELKRGDSVVCRSQRGLERGIVLGPTTRSAQYASDLDKVLEHPESTASHADGRIVRRFTPEDHLLWAHLVQLGSEAHTACLAWLDEQQIAATLLEVEPLLDGKTLFFHFLAEAPAEVQEQLNQLVGIYERQVRQSKFARLLEEGCGPGCGTAEKAGGCGTSGGGCAICAVAKQCKPQANSSK